MAKKKKTKRPVQSFDTAEKAIKERARNLPIYECLISNNWHKLKMAEIIISRKHSNGNITYGVFLIDLYCTGLRDTFYSFNIPQKNYEDIVLRMSNNVSFVPCSYTLAHNIILGSIEFAEQFGFMPDKNFAITEYILDEDSEEIPILDINFGYKGKPTILIFKDSYSTDDINTLKTNAGEGNYTIFDVNQDSMHSDPENTMFEETNVSLEDFLENSPRNNFKETYFIEFVRGSFNKKLIEDKELWQKNKLSYYINDLIDFNIIKEEGLVKIENEAIRAKYFEFYETVDEQKSRKVKKTIPEIEEYFESHNEIPELAALLLKCYKEVKDDNKFETLIEESIKNYPSDFSTRSIALDYYLENDNYDAVLKLLNNSFTIKDYIKEGNLVNITEARIFHLAFFFYFLEKQNLLQAEEYLRVLSMYQKEDTAIKKFLMKLTLAKMFFIDERDQVEMNLPKDILALL